MASRNRAGVVGGIGLLVNGAWTYANRTISVTNLPKDASDAWKVIVSVPAFLPIGLTVVFACILIWAVFWPSEPEIESSSNDARVAGGAHGIVNAGNGAVHIGAVYQHGTATDVLEERNRLDRHARLRELAESHSLGAQGDRERKRALIANGRDLVHRYCESEQVENFEVYIRRDRGYLDLQPYLGEDYQRSVIRHPRAVVLTDDGSSYGAAMFLRELARLEKEWGLL